MKAFSQLLDRLTYTPARNGKLMLMRNYFLATPDPDRGYALAALTDGLPIDVPLRRVLAGLCRGLSTDELTAAFGVSRSTVRTHVRHILEKLHVGNRAEAVRHALKAGLLDDKSLEMTA